MKLLTICFAIAMSACATEATILPPVAPTTPPTTDVGNPAPQVLGTPGTGSSTGGGCLRTKVPCHI